MPYRPTAPPPHHFTAPPLHLEYGFTVPQTRASALQASAEALRSLQATLADAQSGVKRRPPPQWLLTTWHQLAACLPPDVGKPTDPGSPGSVQKPVRLAALPSFGASSFSGRRHYSKVNIFDNDLAADPGRSGMR